FSLSCSSRRSTRCLSSASPEVFCSPRAGTDKSTIRATPRQSHGRPNLLFRAITQSSSFLPGLARSLATTTPVVPEMHTQPPCQPALRVERALPPQDARGEWLRSARARPGASGGGTGMSGRRQKIATRSGALTRGRDTPAPAEALRSTRRCRAARRTRTARRSVRIEKLRLTFLQGGTTYERLNFGEEPARSVDRVRGFRGFRPRLRCGRRFRWRDDHGQGRVP